MDITQDKTFVFPHRVGGNGVYNVMNSLESRTTQKLKDFLDSLGSDNDVWIQCLLYQQETLTLPKIFFKPLRKSLPRSSLFLKHLGPFTNNSYDTK